MKKAVLLAVVKETIIYSTADELAERMQQLQDDPLGMHLTGNIEVIDLGEVNGDTKNSY